MTNSKYILFFLLTIHTSLLSNDFQKIKTFEASFKQSITNPSGNKVSYTGTLHIQEPNKIKWQYKNPIEKLVFIKKHTVTIIEPELEQAIITKIDKEINILNLLKNAVKTSANTYTSNFNNTEYILQLKNQKLTQISYKDEIDNDVIITFKNVQQNHKIDAQTFKFFIPYEFDIIKQ